MGRYVALLRGINVGGNNLIKMKALAACFQERGYENVVTYIQSGNVLFDAGEKTAAKLTEEIEAMLSTTFRYPASVVLLTKRQLRRVVEEAPEGFGADPARYRYDVLYLKPPLTAKGALEKVPAKAGVDQVSAGPGVLFYSRLLAKATQSQLGRVIALPIYKSMTLRNWNTTKKLLALMDGG